MKWWTTFPRKIAYPWKMVCRSSEEFQNLFNKMNGNVNKLYIGMYSCDLNGKMDNVTLDVVGFDMDWENCFDSMKELHEKMIKNDWKHQVLFSSGGFWVYIGCKPREYDKQTAKGKLMAMQDAAIKDTTLFFGKFNEAPLDKSIYGDVERITRMPGSRDKKRGRDVIFLKEADIQAGMDHIIALSESCPSGRKFEITTFGDKIGLDPEDYDYEKPIFTHTQYEIPDVELELDLPKDAVLNSKRMLEMLPHCVRQWVEDPEKATWKGRAYATLYLKERGFTKSQIEEFLKPFYEKMIRTDQWGNNWEHYKNAAQCSDNIFRRKDLKFPNCQTLSDEGLCDGKCSQYKGRYKSPAYR